jgi:hypothetical protein
LAAIRFARKMTLMMIKNQDTFLQLRKKTHHPPSTMVFHVEEEKTRIKRSSKIKYIPKPKVEKDKKCHPDECHRHGSNENLNTKSDHKSGQKKQRSSKSHSKAKKRGSRADFSSFNYPSNLVEEPGSRNDSPNRPNSSKHSEALQGNVTKHIALCGQFKDFGSHRFHDSSYSTFDVAEVSSDLSDSEVSMSVDDIANTVGSKSELKNHSSHSGPFMYPSEVSMSVDDIANTVGSKSELKNHSSHSSPFMYPKPLEGDPLYASTKSNIMKSKSAHCHSSMPSMQEEARYPCNSMSFDFAEDSSKLSDIKDSMSIDIVADDNLKASQTKLADLDDAEVSAMSDSEDSSSIDIVKVGARGGVSSRHKSDRAARRKNNLKADLKKIDSLRYQHSQTKNDLQYSQTKLADLDDAEVSAKSDSEDSSSIDIVKVGARGGVSPRHKSDRAARRKNNLKAELKKIDSLRYQHSQTKNDLQYSQTKLADLDDAEVSASDSEDSSSIDIVKVGARGGVSSRHKSDRAARRKSNDNQKPREGSERSPPRQGLAARLVGAMFPGPKKRKKRVTRSKSEDRLQARKDAFWDSANWNEDRELTRDERKAYKKTFKRKAKR